MNQTTPTTETSQRDLLMCILSYFGILALIPYFARKEDAFIRWHSKQGLMLAAISIVLCVALSLLSWLPLVGTIASMLSVLFGLTIVTLSLYCIVQAYRGQRWSIPVISSLVK